MKLVRQLGQFAASSVALGALVFGAATLFAPRAEAFPRLLCGPTYLWVCSGPGGPDILFPGTICEKAAFERQTGTTCVPYGG